MTSDKRFVILDLEMKKLPSKISSEKKSQKNEDGFANIIPILVLALLLVGTATVVSVDQSKKQATVSKSTISQARIVNDNTNVLGESESGSGSSGSGSSGFGSSDSERSGSSDSGSPGSGSSGSGSSDSRNDDRGNDQSGSGSRTTISSPRPVNTPHLNPSPSPSTLRLDIDEDTKESSPGGRIRVQVDEGQTRLEQEVIKGGVRKRIEMRNENGRIRIKVKVKDLATGVETEQGFEQRPDEGRVSLRVTDNGVEKEVKIKAQNDGFIIEQMGFDDEASASATTRFPLTVDTENNTITVTTPLGAVNVQQLPAQAIGNILAANMLDKVESAELTEPENEADKQDPNKQVVYRIKGVKETKFLGLIKVDAPILTETSAITGKQTFVSQPWFLNAFGFLFTK